MSAPSFTDLLPPTELSDAPAAHQDLCDLLGWMMQLQGTVRIAGLLDAMPRPSAVKTTDDPGEPLASGWDWRIDSIQRVALQPLRDPFSGRGGLVDAPTAIAWLLDHNAIAVPRAPELVHEAAVAFGGAFHGVIGERVAVVRAGIAELRRQLGRRVRDLGPSPAYLDILDQALREATEARTRELFARIPRELARRFEQLLAAELDALPPDASPNHVEHHVQQWYGPDGWLLDHISTCRVALRAACEHEARALKGFVAAVDEMTAAGESDL